MLAWRLHGQHGLRLPQNSGAERRPHSLHHHVVFDMFNGEVVIPLSMGKPIVMADEEEMMLPWKLAQLIERHGVRHHPRPPLPVQMWFSNEAFCRPPPTWS